MAAISASDAPTLPVVTSACTCGAAAAGTKAGIGLVHVAGDLVALGERRERGLGEVEAGEDDGTLSHARSMTWRMAS